MLDACLARLNYALHYLAAVGIFFLALLILADVLGRELMNHPVVGTPELIANSIVVIAFLQVSHSIRIGGVLRASVIDEYLPPVPRRFLLALGSLAGAVLFIIVAHAAFEPMMAAWRNNEYAGVEGLITFPIYPVRAAIFTGSILAAINYLLRAARDLGKKAGEAGQ
jgi:TRAP-type C4-dicarboxylate transport system permease small subunit